MGSNLPPPIHIVPPLLNSASPWATTREDLKRLYECPSTGAVTTRTALLDGFPHDPSVHQYTFFDPVSHASSGGPFSVPGPKPGAQDDAGSECATLNNLGYSPIPLREYLEYIEDIASSRQGGKEDEDAKKRKLIIVSVTGSSPEEVARCYAAVAQTQARIGDGPPLALELNLSCPNIPGKPPPAYEAEPLRAYLRALADAAVAAEAGGGGMVRIPWGVKTPPYTHAGQFDMLVDALVAASATSPPSSSSSSTPRACPASFVTATNTLGSCLVLESDDSTAKLLGGLAGPPLHPLALGNVAALRARLDARPETARVALVGVGGVADAHGYRRMRAAGAEAVALASALGRRGVSQPANDQDYDHNGHTINSGGAYNDNDDDAMTTGTGTTTTAYERETPSSSFTAVESLPPGPWVCRCRRARAAARRFFASRTKHGLVLALVVLDVAGILADIFVALVTCELGREREPWVAPTRAALAHFALAMSCVFVLELGVEVFAEGLGFFTSWFHCFDAFVIAVSFAVDLLEHGVVEEIASLIVVFRLWRFVKIIQEFSVEASEQTEELHKRIEDLEAQKAALEAQLAQR
ncbi:hypothetical protein F4775DRAFT_589295 [Biscogniauxia sp. FL1348]|nr:hypothetical protein F4775DRAFT_589295 [Biscogniauxia sp. FL1348]